MVIRRVGGLEGFADARRPALTVIRRVGGLEDTEGHKLGKQAVIRRVGGLEVPSLGCDDLPDVIRRVGGLEVSGRTPRHFIGITPFQDQLPTTPKEKRRPTSK